MPRVRSEMAINRMLADNRPRSLRADALELVAKVNAGNADWVDVEHFKARGEKAAQIWIEVSHMVQWGRM